jgi:hypothetical protein
MTFKEALKKEKLKNPDGATYPMLCAILQESGASRLECKKLFKENMPIDEYDSHEVDEMVDYLFARAQE